MRRLLFFLRTRFLPVKTARYVCLFLLALGLAGGAHAQVDSSARADTTERIQAMPKVKKQRIYRPDSTHLPKTAIFRSAVVPGWGQVYNHSWWKVPFIYGGFTMLGISAHNNAQLYKKYLRQAQLIDQGLPIDAEFVARGYTSANRDIFVQAKDVTKRNRDISYISIGAVWAVQVVEAYIQAKFQHSYSMDDNLTFRVKPNLIQQPMFAYAPDGIGFTPAVSLLILLK